MKPKIEERIALEGGFRSCLGLKWKRRPTIDKRKLVATLWLLLHAPSFPQTGRKNIQMLYFVCPRTKE